MPTEGYNGSPSKTSINTTRLSAMMDSLDGFNTNGTIDNNKPNESPTTQEKEEQEQDQDQQGDMSAAPALVPPPSLADLPDGSHTPKSFLYTKSPGNKSPGVYSQFSPAGTRLSMYSNYSGVIQEGTGVSYVVKNNINRDNQNNDLEQTNNGLENALEQPPHIEVSIGNPEDDDLEYDSPSKNANKPQRSKSNLIIETIPNAKPVSRYNSLNSKPEVITTTEKAPELPSLPNQQKPTNSTSDSIHLSEGVSKGISKNLSIGSGNLASESGSSAYYPFNHPLEEVLEKGSEETTRNHTPGKSIDNLSSTSSELPPLQTYQTSSVKSLTPDRSEMADYNPTVPLRNRHRPVTRSFLNNELDKIESELKQELNDNNQSHVTVHTKGGDSYFSAESEEPSEAADQLYRDRRVPSNPAPRNNNNNKTKVRGTLPHIANIANSNKDDGFEDIEEGHIFSNHPSRSSRDTYNHRQKREKSSRHKKNASNSFDTNTLSQLLMITKGTLVGSEFSNLGMKLEEKRALERLVDSLSRLTADMILDPDRYNEGIKRLNNAVKALDGF
ncbi:similar to Saccharomyces cerevisiae YOL070C NBA1 Protein of unknown function, localizes to the bud neck and cytoplasm [Maudiozyma saulgeensis]|uniref:Protein NBA1 n=1 Tax=Maudiozyma saulgeensis TaxID=1789683 RepID=A0A1X7R3I5_9SACH|nr:similar to Saccharomyces cerevisiae YOL070C NBA1 Protein of unknown function, localizes to the bud neck and cytoplasm [Kazachstania saulgeensis]